MKYQYHIEEGPRLTDVELDALGARGWELSQVLTIPMYTQTNRVFFHYIFIREGEE